MRNELHVRLSTTTVRFREIGKREMRSCLADNKIYDIAGAYTIQGIASAFIVQISVSYSGVMGLPLFETAQLLEESGIEIFP